MRKEQAVVRVTISEPGYRRVRVFRGTPAEIEHLCQQAGTFVFEWPTCLSRAGLLPPKKSPLGPVSEQGGG